jgi:hypothetical protein
MHSIIHETLSEYKFSKDGYMLEFTIVYSEYNDTDGTTIKVVIDYQRYSDVLRHIDMLFNEGVHDVRIGCNRSSMTRDNLYDMLYDEYQNRGIDENEDLIGDIDDGLYL